MAIDLLEMGCLFDGFWNSRLSRDFELGVGAFNASALSVLYRLCFD